MVGDDRVRYDVADGIATITFDRPDKLNALTFAMVDSFVARLDEAGDDPYVRVVVLKGSGRAFSAGVDIDSVLAFTRPLLAERPRTGPQLRAAIAEQFPHLHAAALAYACRNRLAFVQVPPRGLWGKSGQVTSTTAEAWLGRPLVTNPSIDNVVVRYLGAFGPASVADVASWSGLAGLREVLERLRPRLRTFHDERRRELFDLPDAPRPDPDTPAPPRFLPEYDNVLLSHADRGRFVDARAAGIRWDTRIVRGTVLHDGVIAGTWHIEPDDAHHTLVVHHFEHLRKRALNAISSEATRFVRFHEGTDTTHDIRFVASAG